MKPPLPNRAPDLTSGLHGDGALSAKYAQVRLADLAGGNPLSVRLASLAGAHVLIRTHSQLNAALALVALDGIAARLVIAPPDLKGEHLPDVIARAGLDTLVTDGDAIMGLSRVAVSPDLKPADS